MTFSSRRFHAPPLLDPLWMQQFRHFRQLDCPLDLEIGCGVGLHPLARARQHPERQLVAIEHTRLKFDKFWRRLRHHPEVRSLLPVHANAISWVHEVLPAEAADQVFLLYPNPEPQNPNKRWFRMPFMGRLLDSVCLNGTLHLATNREAYANEAREWAERHWGLEILRFDRIEPTFTPRTHFEKKYLARGEVCFDLQMKKVSPRLFYFPNASED